MNTFLFLVTSAIFLSASYSPAAGNMKDNLDSRIYNGYPAEIKNTKHQVSIRWKVLDNFIFGLGHLCGGSLISPNIVLTAAHCLRDSSDKLLNATQLIVAMGTLWRNIEDNNTLIYDVKSYVSHRNYNSTVFSYDIAYVVLDSEVPANHPTVQPIELVDAIMPDDTLCQVTGWGYTEQGIPSDNLLTVDVRIIDTQVCNQGYEGILPVIGQLCAGYMAGGKDACGGDSGGPLVCEGKLTGVVSNGKGCAMENHPGVYTDVMFFRDWIDKLNLERKLQEALLAKCGGSKMPELSIGTLIGLVILLKVISIFN